VCTTYQRSPCAKAAAFSAPSTALGSVCMLGSNPSAAWPLDCIKPCQRCAGKGGMRARGGANGCEGDERAAAPQAREPMPSPRPIGRDLHVPFPARRRLYVIGDIHGRSDLLDRLVGEIGRDLKAAPMDDCLTVTIGDYIDRGPDSRGVLERLARNPFPTEFVALKGNHEALFETFLRDPSVAGHWRRLGGLETLH